MKYSSLFILLIGYIVNAQVNFSNQWKDLFSYNEVKDFTIADNILYAVTGNAMFIYDIDEDTTSKISSINGLSGNITSTVAFNSNTKEVLIGYENGLLEVVTEEQNVIPLTGLRDDLLVTNKTIDGIVVGNTYTYIYGDFGISQLNLEKVEFRTTFNLSVDDSNNAVNDLLFYGDKVYGATENGLYVCDTNLDFTNFQNWQLLANGNISKVAATNFGVFISISNKIYEINNVTTSIYSNTNNVLDLEVNSLTDELIVTTKNKTDIIDSSSFSVTQKITFSNDDLSFTSSRGIVTGNDLYLNSESYGVLRTSLNFLDDEPIVFSEIHPGGPTANDVFSITSTDGKKWITYGGYVVNGAYGALGRRRGVDFFNGESWINYPRNQIGGLSDYTMAIIDPNNQDRVFIGSYSNGVVELEDGVYKTTWEDTNTEEIIPHHRSSKSANWQAGFVVDNNNNVWVANARGFNNRLFSKYDSSLETWTESADFTFDSGDNTGINKIFTDNNNNIFAGSRFQGLLAFNADDVGEGVTRPTAVLSSDMSRGNLISSEVLCGAVDDNNRIWIGTDLGLMVFDDYDNIYNAEVNPAETIIIEEDGDAKELLTNIRINDIVIDQANTLWIATHTAGVFNISANGQKTLNSFNTSNSPMPSDTVTDLEIDEETGLLYIVTDLGVLEYDSQSEPFSDEITEVVAYPNPAISNIPDHEFITIVAKNGEGLPEGTNIKILDISGKLVFEQNVANDGSTTLGGKIVWNKKNLAGKSVVSGIYVVLISNADGTQNTSTKIAIVN